jgi:hypothetical protein
MKSKIIYFAVMFFANIEFALADFPYYVQCPHITSVVEPEGTSIRSNHFIYYSSRENEPYPAEEFLGADIDSKYTFSCYYAVSDGARITAKFSSSKCTAMHGFDSSGKCNNSDPEQCMAVCSY